MCINQFASIQTSSIFTCCSSILHCSSPWLFCWSISSSYSNISSSSFSIMLGVPSFFLFLLVLLSLSYKMLSIDLDTLSPLTLFLNLSYHPLLKVKFASPPSYFNIFLASIIICLLLQFEFSLTKRANRYSRIGCFAFRPPSLLSKSWVSNHLIIFFGWIRNLCAYYEI